MLPVDIVEPMVDEYLGDNEDPKTLMAQFQEMMADVLFVMPALHVAHFQREFTLGYGMKGRGSNYSIGSLGNLSYPGTHPHMAGSLGCRHSCPLSQSTYLLV